MTFRFARVVGAVTATFGAMAAGAWMDGVRRVARDESGAPARVRMAEEYPGRAEAGAPARVPIAEEYPRRDEAGEICIGDALTIDGQPMQLSAFTTRDPLERVVQFYEEAFARRGLIPVAAAQGRFGHVSVFDPADGLQRFVTAIPERPGHTLVLLGATDPRAFAAMRSAPSARYPIPDQRRAFVGYESRDGPLRARSAQFVSALSAAQMAAYYRTSLAARGFVEQPESSPALLAFASRTERISVAIQALEEEHGAAVFVVHVEGNP